ncbi:MAG: dephospho-CoA kinase [Paludibacteraceae bacterium]|nr:dephospho-CoA kinase [Paludibacteraceae bacterium]
MLVGITGGIGSGKSTIVQVLAARGYAVYDCDREAKRIIVENAEVRKAIIALLGTEAFVPSPQHPFTGSYNTSYVSQRVFAEPELLQQLNAIVHPAVKEDIRVQSSEFRVQNSEFSVLFVESAILFEAGIDSLCDRIVVVDAPEEVRLQRTIARDYHGDATEEHINKVRARMRAQQFRPSDEQKASKKVLTINNDGRTSISDLANEIIQFIS